jgi:2-dehydropantoate 2-reductase
MRIVIYGAGGVGGVIGGRLFQHAEAHGCAVTLVTRGAHFEAIRERGLVLNDPGGSVTLPIPVVDRIDAVELEPDDVVILTMKSQDTAAAVDALASHASGIAVACAQNGVENERRALRCFERVYGICVILPAVLMEPGIVDANGWPRNAILDVGRYPSGVDATAHALAAAFEASGLASRADPAVMRLKYAKLLMNLANSLDALVPDARAGSLYRRARREAEECFDAAGIDYATTDEDRARRTGVMEQTPIAGRTRTGGSTWQSLARGSAHTEVEFLNGEVALLGRIHGIPTPVNAMLQDAMRRAAAEGLAPRSLTVEELEARLRRAS